MNRLGRYARLAAGCVAAAVLLIHSAAPAQTPGPAELSVDGSAASPLHLSVAELRKQFAGSMRSVDYQSHGKPHTAMAVPLLAVLQAAGVPTDMHPAPGATPHDKHRPVRIVIEASADDGYAVVFSMAELLPDLGHESAWLAIEEDGQPLAAKDQPVDLIVPADAKPARWVHGVTHLTASDYSPAAATQP